MYQTRCLFLSLLFFAIFGITWAQENPNPHVGRLTSQTAEFTALAMNKDCKFVVGGFSTGQMIVMDPIKKGFATMNAWTAHAKNITAIAISPDQKTIVTGGIDGTIKFWSSELCQKYQNDTEARRDDPKIAAPAITVADRILKQGHTGGVRGLSFSPDGKYLASCGADSNFKIWVADLEKPLMIVPAHKSGANVVCFTNDGKYLVSGGGDKLVKFWAINGDDATCTKTIEHSSAVTSVNFRHDGKQMVTGSGTAKKSGEVRIWDPETGEELYSLKGHGDVVTGVAFHPKEARLASASRDKTLRVWNLDTKAEGYREEFREAFGGTLYSADNRLLAAFTSREAIWWLSTPAWPKKK